MCYYAVGKNINIFQLIIHLVRSFATIFIFVFQAREQII